MSSKYHSEGGRDTVIEIDKLYTPAEAAALIHETVRPAAILRAIQEGRLPAARIGKSKPLVCGADLMTFIEASRCPAPTKALDSNSMVLTTNTGPGAAQGIQALPLVHRLVGRRQKVRTPDGRWRSRRS